MKIYLLIILILYWTLKVFNKFIIITTMYNPGNYIEMCANTIRFQNYQNFEWIVIDDHSNDGSYEYCLEFQKSMPNMTVLQTDHLKTGQGGAYMKVIDYLEANDLIYDEDIIIEVDSDDWLYNSFVIQYINEEYENNIDVWMTGGQYIIYPFMKIGGHYNLQIPEDIDNKNSYRKNAFPYSHLKTYKYHLFKRINRIDLIDEKTGKIFNKAWDHALCISMVEMAGKFRIRFVKEITYVLNRSRDLSNEGKTQLNAQKEIELEIRSRPVYERIK